MYCKVSKIASYQTLFSRLCRFWGTSQGPEWRLQSTMLVYLHFDALATATWRKCRNGEQTIWNDSQKFAATTKKALFVCHSYHTIIWVRKKISWKDQSNESKHCDSICTCTFLLASQQFSCLKLHDILLSWQGRTSCVLKLVLSGF